MKTSAGGSLDRCVRIPLLVLSLLSNSFLVEVDLIRLYRLQQFFVKEIWRLILGRAPFSKGNHPGRIIAEECREARSRVDHRGRLPFGTGLHRTSGEPPGDLNLQLSRENSRDLYLRAQELLFAAGTCMDSSETFPPNLLTAPLRRSAYQVRSNLSWAGSARRLSRYRE